jgi:orotate phosphoribosyltransferase
MNSDELKQVFIETKAFLEGHFELSSGLHSNQYVQCALVLQYPHIAEKLASLLAKEFADSDISCVIGPALGGVTFAYEIARQLKVRGIFAERKDGVMQLRRGFSLSQNDRILVVEDVITTGGSVKEVIALLEHMGHTVIGVGSLIDRSKADPAFGYPFKALLRMPLEAYNPDECPFCKKGIAVTKPGSKTISRT